MRTTWRASWRYRPRRKPTCSTTPSGASSPGSAVGTVHNKRWFRVPGTCLHHFFWVLGGGSTRGRPLALPQQLSESQLLGSLSPALPPPPRLQSALLQSQALGLASLTFVTVCQLRDLPWVHTPDSSVVLQGPFSAALSCAVCSHPTSVLICPESARLAIQGTGLMTISRASTLGVLNNSTLRLRGKAAPQPHPLPNFLNPYMAFQSGPSALLLKRAPPFPLSSRCDHHAFPMEDHPLPSPQEHLGPAWGVTLQPGA